MRSPTPTAASPAAAGAKPLAGLVLALVGPGRVGSSVARWLLAAGAGLGPVVRRGPGRRLPSWAARQGGRAATLDQLCDGGEHLLLLAVPDPELPAVVARLSGRPQAPVVLHVSGALDAEVLAPLRSGGSAVGAFHPLKAFARPQPRLAAARDTFFALDGDRAAVALGARLAAACGGAAAVVAGEVRPLYHLAATWAAGGSVTLVAAAAGLHRELGLPPSSSAGLLALARGALAAASAERLAAGTTGPVARGELRYLEQLATLRERAPALHPLAVLLALETLRQLAADRPLDPAREALRQGLLEVSRTSGFLDPLDTWV